MVIIIYYCLIFDGFPPQRRAQEVRIQEIQRQEEARQALIRCRADRLVSAERARTATVRCRLGLPTDHTLPTPPPCSRNPRFSVRVNGMYRSTGPADSLTSVSSLSSVDTHTPSELMHVYPLTPEPTPVWTPTSEPKKIEVSQRPVLQKTRFQSVPKKNNASAGQSENVQHASCPPPQLPVAKVCSVAEVCSPQAPAVVPKPPIGPRPKTQNIRPGRTLRPSQKGAFLVAFIELS